MIYTLMILSIFLQYSVAYVVLRISYRIRSLALLLMAMAVLLMGVRRSVSLYNQLAFDRSIHLGPEIIALTISVLMLLGVIGLRRLIVENRYQSAHGLEKTESQLTGSNVPRLAILLGLAAMLVSGALGYLAFRSSRDAIQQSIFQSNLIISQAIAKYANSISATHSDALTFEEIEEMWQRIDKPLPNSYLCLVNSDGVLLLNTSQAKMVGTNVGYLPIETGSDSGPKTLQALVSAREDWVGNFTSANGESQMAACAYVPRLTSMVIIHTLTKDINAVVSASVLPWVGEMVFTIFLLIPLSLGLLYWVHVHSMRDRDLAMSALRESKQKENQQWQELEQIYKKTPVGLGLLDKQLRYLRINEQLAVINGVPVCEHIGRTVREVVPYVASQVEHILLQVIESGKPTGDMEHHGLTPADPDHEQFWIVNYCPLISEQGEVYAVSLVVQDITERKRIETALEVSEQRLLQALEAVSGGVFDWHLETGERIRSDSWYKLSGFERGELESWEAEHGSIVHPDDKVVMREMFKAHLRGERDRYDLEFRIRHKSGERRWLRGRGIVVERTPDGSPKRIVGTDIDITERKQVEAALRDSEERFRIVFEAAPSGMVIADADGKSLRYNDAMQNMLGYSEDELRSMDNSLYTHADDIAEGKRLFADLREGKRDHYQVEKRYIRKDGKVVWAILSCSSVRDDLGNIQYLIASVKDITDRKRAEEALRESEERFRVVFESVPFGMAVMDPNGTPISYNTALQEMLGYSEQELLEKNASQHTHTDDVEATQKLYTELREGKREFYQIDKRYIRKDGEIVWGSLAFSSVRNAKGDVQYLIATVKDITERKNTEKALRESEVKYRSLVESANAVPYKLNLATGRFTYIGQQIEQLSGYPMSSWVDFDTWSSRIHPEDRQQARAYCINATLRGKDHEFEYRAIAADGRHVWIRDVVSVIMGDDGPKEVIGFMFDITERKHAEEQARQLQADLAHMSRLSTMGEMASGLAHELNQPLTVITNYANGCIRRLHSENLSQDELKDMLERISAQARRGGSIIRGLESLVRKGEAKRVPIDINESILEIVDLTEVDAKRHKAITHLELKPKLPSVLADSTQVQQVILNLVQNACEACEQVPVSQRVVTVHTAWAGEDELEITISDSGPGVASELGERLFEPFFTTKAKGMGMGLAISRSIIEAHNGKLWTTANPESGASFHFTLPIAKEDKPHGK